MRRLLSELGRFILTQKKFWLIPVLLVLVLMLVLVILSAKGGVLAPFIYPLF
ncbi:MAG TPA: DUF5989 family protein [Gemmatimonadaceae bacterium]|nr:DUF5989 family protein [Gemmatimonadaceae bacterium]